MKLLLSLFLVLFLQEAVASQLAIVVADKAVVYADKQMTSPLGFIPRGKKIKVAEKARNNGQVYPMVLSGKLAFIRVSDVSTEKEAVDSKELVAERFLKSAREEHKKRYSLSFLHYGSQIGISKENSDVKNKDTLNWSGLSLKGEVLVHPKWDLQVLFNYLTTTSGEEEFRTLEVGLGPAYRILETKNVLLRWDGHVLLSPFSQYILGDEFRVNGYGAGVGSNLNLSYSFGGSWGAEAYGGFYYTKLMGFNVPSPYEKIGPSFVGNRLGVGLNYRY